MSAIKKYGPPPGAKAEGRQKQKLGFSAAKPLAFASEGVAMSAIKKYGPPPGAAPPAA